MGSRKFPESSANAVLADIEPEYGGQFLRPVSRARIALNSNWISRPTANF